MRHWSALTALVTVVIAALTSCSGGETSDPSTEPHTNTTTPSEEASPSSAQPQPVEPAHLPAGDLPGPLRLSDIGANTVKAEPFADFAVTVGPGVWVSGVNPGAVRYDDVSGQVTARASVPGEVAQALGATQDDVLVPVTSPALLMRIAGTTGEVLARVKLPASPLPEASVGVEDDISYVLVDQLTPRIVVVEGDRIVDEIRAPEGATAVRAAFGSLWVPTTNHEVERYSLKSRRWTAFPAGSQPRFLDAGFGAVWVMNQGDGSVTRIDARSGSNERLPITGEPIGGGDLTVGGGAVWLRTDSQVARIEPSTRAVTHLINLPPGSASAAATDDVLVITNHDHDAVHLVPLPLPG